MEPFSGIDFEVATGTIIRVCEFINVVLIARTTSVTIAVKSITTWGVAFMSCCLPSPLVCFHDIKFRTVVSINLICIAIPVPVCVPELPA